MQRLTERHNDVGMWAGRAESEASRAMRCPWVAEEMRTVRSHNQGEVGCSHMSALTSVTSRYGARVLDLRRGVRLGVCVRSPSAWWMTSPQADCEPEAGKSREVGSHRAHTCIRSRSANRKNRREGKKLQGQTENVLECYIQKSHHF